MTEAVSAVKRGAKLLDTYCPGWAKKIKLAKFDLGDATHCVLGQVHKDFSEGLQVIAQAAVTKALKPAAAIQMAGGETLTDTLNQNVPDIDATHYGFDADGNASYEDLTTQWLREFAKRGVKK